MYLWCEMIRAEECFAKDSGTRQTGQAICKGKAFFRPNYGVILLKRG